LCNHCCLIVYKLCENNFSFGRKVVFLQKLLIMSRYFSYQLEDDAGELVTRYEKYLQGSDPGYFDVDEMERIVDFYLLYGRTKDSLNAVELGKKLHPSSSALDTKRAKIYLATGDVNKAYRILSNLLEDSDTEVIYLKIEALVKLERLVEARALANVLIDEENEEVDQVCIDIAMIFMAESKIDYAYEILGIGDKHNPKNIDLLFELAFCQEQKSLLPEAIATYLRIIDIDTYIGEAWFNLGQIHFILNEFEEAIEAYDYALVINEKDSISLLQKAHAHFQLNQLELAIETYLAYTEMITEKWQVMLFVGESYEKLENFPKAYYYYKLSLDEMEDNYDALIGISVCMLEMEQYSECMEYIQRAMKINDGMSEAWVYMAEAYIGLDNVDEALEAYLKAISIDPNQADTLLAIGNIYMDNAEFQLALKYYEAAFSLDATLENIELFLSVANYYTGNYEETADYLKQALSRNLDAAQLFLELCPGAEKTFLSPDKPEVK